MKNNISYEEARACGDLRDYQEGNDSEDDASEFPVSGYNGNDNEESGDIDE